MPEILLPYDFYLISSSPKIKIIIVISYRQLSYRKIIRETCPP